MSDVKQKPRFEARNVMYFKAKDYSQDDMLLVNEKIHMPNGEIKSRLRQILNFEKPIYIHKEGYRKYTQKQVWMPKDQMDVYYSTESKLNDTIKRIFNIPLNRYVSLRELCRSPYIYGADLATTVIMKKKYMDAYPNTTSPATVAVLDIETNVDSVRGEIIAISLSFKKKAIVATTKDFLGTTPLPKEQFFKKAYELIPEVMVDRKVDVEFYIADTPAQAVLQVFKRAHEWKPDFITGWNLLGFDIPKIISELEIEGYDPAQVFSDPSIEPRFRECVYHKGRITHRNQLGVERPLANYEQWHWVSCPSSFFFIDAMCLYFQIRKGKPLEENYKLETILTKELGEGKLKIAETDHLDGLQKHYIEQTKYKIEYLVYNLYDCVGVELLDEKTRDLSKTFNVLIGVSDFGNYTSNPKQLVDNISFFVQEDPRFNGVLATASDQQASKLDDYVPGLSDWIVTLPTERLLDTGMKIIKELPDHVTKVHATCFDIDVSSGYPNIERAMNMSKDTTMHELHRIEGLTYREQQLLGLSMLGGKANSLAFAKQVYKLPYPKEVWEHYQNQQKQ